MVDTNVDISVDAAIPGLGTKCGSVGLSHKHSVEFVVLFIGNAARKVQIYIYIFIYTLQNIKIALYSISKYY